MFIDSLAQTNGDGDLHSGDLEGVPDVLGLRGGLGAPADDADLNGRVG